MKQLITKKSIAAFTIAFGVRMATEYGAALLLDAVLRKLDDR